MSSKYNVVTLPCDLGDTIYSIEPCFYNYYKHTGVQKGKVTGFECEANGTWVIWTHMVDDSEGSGLAFEFSKVGTLVFFDKHEAIDALNPKE